MKQKLKSWLKRYLLAEIAGTLTAIFAGFIADSILHNILLMSFFASWGENIGFYGAIISRDLFTSVKDHKGNDLDYGVKSFAKDIRNIIVEFGPSEVLDSFIVRPFAMYLFTTLTQNVALGILMGKITADIIFYLPTVVMFELRKKYLK